MLAYLSVGACAEVDDDSRTRADFEYVRFAPRPPRSPEDCTVAFPGP